MGESAIEGKPWKPLDVVCNEPALQGSCQEDGEVKEVGVGIGEVTPSNDLMTSHCPFCGSEAVAVKGHPCGDAVQCANHPDCFMSRIVISRKQWEQRSGDCQRYKSALEYIARDVYCFTLDKATSAARYALNV